MGVKEGKGEDKQKKPEGDGGGPTTVVLKVALHCEGCALKIKRSVKRFDGVETVSVDIAGNKLTVVGKVDPVLLRERVEEKTRKKVELVSSVDSATKPTEGAGDTKKPAAGGDTKKAAAAVAASSAVDGGAVKEGKKPTDGKKSKAPQASTVVLKIRLHCEDCISRIRKSIYKIKGVGDVSVDVSKDLVTVKGTMDPKILPSILKDKLKRGVEIIPSKKDDGSGDKKVDVIGKKESDDGDKKKDAGDAGEKKKDSGGEEKKKEGGDAGEKKKDSGGEEKKKEGGDAGQKKKESGESGGGEKKKEGGDAGEKKIKSGGEEKKKEGGDGAGDKKEGGGDKKKETDSDNNNMKNEVDKATSKVTINKMEFYGSYGYPIEIAPSPYEYRFEMGSTSYEYGVETTQAPHEYMYEMAQTPYGYGVNMTHAPQIFSDENPNACFIM